MPIDTAAVSVSLNSAYALVDALRCALTGSSCSQWTGTGGESYRLRKNEVVAQAPGSPRRYSGGVGRRSHP